MAQTTYDKVSTSSDVDVGQEEEEKGALLTAQNSCKILPLWFIVIGIAVLSFVAGIAVTVKIFPILLYRKETCDAVVSYGFLNSEKGQALQSQLTDIWKQHGPVPSLLQMAQLMQEDSQIASSCHPFLHQLGRLAWKEHPKNNDSKELLESTFLDFLGTSNENLMRTCNAAYMHGLIEEHLKNYVSHDSANIQEEATWIQDHLCSGFQPLKGKGLSDEWECQHGVGHGILQHQRVLLQQTALEQALQICEQVFTESEGCQNGVWMDYWAYQGMTTDMDLEGAEDPLSICTTMDAIPPCRLYGPTAYLLRHPRDYVGAMKRFCLHGNELCVRGVGMQTAKENMLDFQPLEKACLSAPIQFLQNQCFKQGVHYYKTASKSETIPTYLCHHLSAFKQECLKNT